MTLRVYLIAGEPSGDLLGSRVMRALKKQTRNQVKFMGVGGETMYDEGLKSLFNIRDLAVMGFLEVVPSVPKVLHRLNEIIMDIQKKKPDIIMTIDSYSFSIRVHQKLKKLNLGIPHVHCVAPQVWAWKAGRAKTLPKYIDHLFCLLPWEEEYFKPYGLKTTFTGHPVIEGGADKGSAQAFCQKYNLKKSTQILVLLPGSRKNEVKRLMPIFKQACERLHKTHPHLFVVIPSVATVAPTVCEMLECWHIPHTIILGEKKRYDAFAAADVAIAASGTVSLELSLAKVPHLIAYRVHPLTAKLAKRLIKIRFADLVNYVQNKEIIPELLQQKCTVQNLVKTAEKLFKNPKQNVQKSLDKLKGKMLPSEIMAKVLIHLAKDKK